MLEIAQAGTLYVYQGEEIGMANMPSTWGIEEYKDVATQNYYNRFVYIYVFYIYMYMLHCLFKEIERTQSRTKYGKS